MANIKILDLPYLSLELNNEEINSVRGGIQRPGHLMTPEGQHTDISVSINIPGN